MKRFYSLFLVALTCMLGFAANAQDELSFTFTVNEPSHVTVSVDGTPVALTGNTTVVPFKQYAGVNIQAESGWGIKSFANGAGAPISFQPNYAYFSPDDKATYVMEVYNMEEARTASCTVTVDDATKVRAMLSGTYTAVNLVNGAQTIKFNPETEKELMFSSAGGTPIYKVELNGTPVSGSYGSYSVPLTQGCAINVMANFPEGDADVTFTYGDKGEGFWTGASVNGTPVENFDGKKFSAAFGSQISISGDINNYAYQNITVNGNPVQYFYGECSFTLTENTEVHVDAHPFGTISFTINIDDPANVTFSQTDQYGPKPITGLVAGSNTVTISEKNTTVNIAAKPGCFITSIKDGDGNMLGNSVNVTEGMAINVISGAITLDKTAVIWIDDISAASYYFNCVLDMGSERKSYELVSGYNRVQFSEQYNDFNIGWAGASVNMLFLNQQLQDPQYQGVTTYLLDLAENDVVKLFLGTAPEDVKVNFTSEGEAQATVKRDILTDITDWAGLREQVFAGTEYVISAGPEIKVSVNGTGLVSEAGDGVYKFTTAADTKEYNVVISATSGVSDVAVDGVSAEDAVYNMQGVRVGRRADLETMPSGLYIVGDKKVIKH